MLTIGINLALSGSRPPSGGGGGGGGLTELFKLDFVTAGNTHVNGTPAAIADNVQEDTNDWGSTFDLSDIVPGTGWVMESNYGFAFSGSILPLILAGCTVVVDFSVDANSVDPAHTDMSYLPFDIIKNDFSVAVTAFGEQDFSGINDGPGTHVDNSAPAFVEGANKYAFTATSTLLALSINGSSAASIANPVIAGAEWADIYWNSPMQVSPPISAGICTLRSITGYAAQVAADLVALSAT